MDMLASAITVLFGCCQDKICTVLIKNDDTIQPSIIHMYHCNQRLLAKQILFAHGCLADNELVTR